MGFLMPVETAFESNMAIIAHNFFLMDQLLILCVALQFLLLPVFSAAGAHLLISFSRCMLVAIFMVSLAE